MKFKVTTNIKPNMFGRINGSITLAGNGDCPYDIEWLIDQILAIGYFDVVDKKVIKEKRKYVLDSLKALEVNRGYSIGNRSGQLAMLVLRVKDDTKFEDVLREELKEYDL